MLLGAIQQQMKCSGLPMSNKEKHMEIENLFFMAKTKAASDLHIRVGLPPMLRIHGILEKIDVPPLEAVDAEKLVQELLYSDELKKKFQEGREVDFAFQQGQTGRYRVNVFKQNGTCAAALRRIESDILSMEHLGLPSEILQKLCHNAQGLVLVTGPTGSGKSTTLAAMVDYINQTRNGHILTLEDPIEYVHEPKESMISQREIGVDTKSYSTGLRAALREDPDVILVGEMRDAETIATAITAAETGHLVLSTLHTVGAGQTIDRIIDVFPAAQQGQIRAQLANLLKGVISQQLLTNRDCRGRCVAYEALISTPAISNLIREGKSYQINSHIQTGGNLGMQTMDTSLIHLYRQGKITEEQVMSSAIIPGEIKRMLNIS